MVRLNKVLKLKIHAPIGMDWNELGKLLRDCRYSCRRFGNSIVNDALRAGIDVKERMSYGQINKQVRESLEQEECEIDFSRFSKTGVVPDLIANTFFQAKIRPHLTKGWGDILRGRRKAPEYKQNTPICIASTKPGHRRMVKMENGDVSLELAICRTPYPYRKHAH